MAAFDSIYPEQTSTATVEVNVLRNEARPRWLMQHPIEVKIKETEQIGTEIVMVEAQDPDGVSDMRNLFYWLIYDCIMLCNPKTFVFETSRCKLLLLSI